MFPDWIFDMLRHRFRLVYVLLASLVTLDAHRGAAGAGLGPENVAVVVNDRSWTSKTVANHYVQLRQIPPQNVIYLDRVRAVEQIPVEEFRETILRPLMAALTERGLEPQIECIAYSTDFPWRIDVRGDIPPETQLPRFLTPYGSLTGMTYLGDLVERKDINYLQLNSNAYFRPRTSPGREPTPEDDDFPQVRQALEHLQKDEHAQALPLLEVLLKNHEKSALLWYNHACCLSLAEREAEALKSLERAVENGWSNLPQTEGDEDLAALRTTDEYRELLERMRKPLFDVEPAFTFSHRREFVVPFRQEPIRYRLTTALGVTGGRGNSVAEVLHGLQRSREADGTRPAGVFVFARNQDIRTKTREGWFAAAEDQLRKLGLSAATVDGNLPKDEPLVAGVVAGVAGFDWAAAESTLVPGALAEHLTSFGAMLDFNASQTPISEWIRHGAAGTSGTVHEPYALQAKFPTPFLHVHYARGFTLAEAFYLSVSGPYQLLIVGDPLCRPWGSAPEFAFEFRTPEADRPVLKCAPHATENIAKYEYFLNGRPVASHAAGESKQIALEDLPDGYHRLTVSAVADAPAATRGSKTFGFTLGLRAKPPELVQIGESDTGNVAWGVPLRFSASCDAAKSLSLHHNGRVLGTIESDSGVFEIASEVLGIGPVALIVSASGDDWRTQSEPLILSISPPPIHTAIAVEDASTWSAGLVLIVGENRQTIESLQAGNALSNAGVQPGDPFQLEGYTQVDRQDLYQLVLHGNVPLTLELNGIPVELPADDSEAFRNLPLALEAGWHRFVFRGTLPESSECRIEFGNRGRRPLDGTQFRSPPP